MAMGHAGFKFIKQNHSIPQLPAKLENVLMDVIHS